MVSPVRKWSVKSVGSFNGVTAQMAIGRIWYMWFWWFMFICDLLTPFLMIFAGRMMWKHTPKNMNGAIGYRTSRSMKNIETWRFANNHCGKTWCKIGKFMLFSSALLHLPFYGSSIETIGSFGAILCTVQVIILIISIFPTEKALKRNFTEDGVQKQPQYLNQQYL